MASLPKHGLDFADVGWVLESGIRLDVPVVRKSEARIQSLAYVLERLRVLVVVHVPENGSTRIVSFRTASTEERSAYHDWLAQKDAEADPSDDQETAKGR